MVSFVDDNKIFMNFKATDTISLMYKEMEKGVKTWRDILRITGGDLQLEKTWIGMLIFNYKTYGSSNMNKHALY